jgi:hypothetical protein
MRGPYNVYYLSLLLPVSLDLIPRVKVNNNCSMRACRSYSDQ